MLNWGILYYCWNKLPLNWWTNNLNISVHVNEKTGYGKYLPSVWLSNYPSANVLLRFYDISWLPFCYTTKELFFFLTTTIRHVAQNQKIAVKIIFSLLPSETRFNKIITNFTIEPTSLLRSKKIIHYFFTSKRECLEISE